MQSFAVYHLEEMCVVERC